MIVIGWLIPLAVLGGIAFAIVSGVRALNRAGAPAPGETGTALDTAEIAKSVAIHVGLFLAFIGCVVGAIDLLQFFVEESDRLAGTNSDLARGLSILLVSGPAFGFLLRAVHDRHRHRGAAGDTRPHRGWSVYLVAALSTSLVATLVSVAQITERITDNVRDFEPAELMQLIVWLAAWLGHWFWLRPRYRVLGAVHVAIGSILGLAWMVAGVGAVIYRILAEGYDRAFSDSLITTYGVELWIVIGLTGAGVWAWHWLGHFNAPGSVEGDRRKSALWFFTVVVAGVLPGLITMLVTVTGMASGLLIWFVGTTDETAAEFFEPAPALITLAFVGFVTWAYHRWTLERGGHPTRNEALRFHDYVVVTVGLVGVVGAVAALVAQLVATLGAGGYFAGSFSDENAFIVIVTVLVAAATIWWRQWSRIEIHRASEPFAESDSIWRKLYLTAGFGVAGVVLSVAVIWVLFTFLRDLFDGELGRLTLEDLAGPLGWAIAVVGAVWFHLDVWRVDRRVIAAHEAATVAPVPPAPAATPLGSDRPPSPGDRVGLVLRPASPADFGELYTLQRAAAVDEALALGTIDLATVRESFDDFRTRMARSRATVAVDAGRIVGVAVSSSPDVDRDREVVIDRLIVAPDRTGADIEDRLRRAAGRS